MAAETSPLLYDRQTLIDSLNERIAEREAARAAKKQAADEKNKEARDAIVEALDTYPSFLVWLSNTLNREWSSRPGTGAFADAVANAYKVSDEVAVEPHDPDEDLKRLVRIYEKATNETIELTVYDDVIRYL